MPPGSYNCARKVNINEEEIFLRIKIFLIIQFLNFQGRRSFLNLGQRVIDEGKKSLFVILWPVL